MTLADPIHRAIEIHRAGRLAEAIPLYRALLIERPEDPDLRHLLALALIDLEPVAAQAELRRALVLAPAISLYLHNAVQFADPSDQVGMARLLAHALAVDPMRAIAQHSLGALDARVGRYARAARRFRRALALDPALPSAIFDHANTLTEAGRLPQACTEYAHLLAVDPIHQSGLTNLGALLYRLGSWPEADAVFTRLVRCAPDNADALAALGACRAERGNIAGAIGSVHSALVLDPASANTWHTFATLLLKDPAGSSTTLRAATRATCLAPTMTEPHITRALVLFHQGRIHDAIAARRAALVHAPSDAQAHYEYLPFLHLDPDLDPPAQLAIRRGVHRRFSDPLARALAPHTNTPDPDRRLKLGYVDNRMLNRSTHSTNLLPMIEAHDPRQVALHFYTNLPEAMADDMTQRYRATAARFHHTGGLSDEEAALLVRADEIDILIDVSSHLTGVRTGLLARKPAPIQVTMLQVGSSGLDTMDYAVADPILLPVDKPSYFSEEIIRLPVGFLFEPVADLTPAITPLPLDRPPTFGSLNLLAKIDEPVLALWTRALNRATDSRLLLKAAGLASADTRQRLLDFFARRGIAPERLDLRTWTSDYAAHLATFDEIDIVLDCFPYPGMTTSLEALLMGVPVVTLAGDRFVSRIGEAILKTIGHPEWVARDEDEYIAIASALADDPSRRAKLKEQLRGELLSSPLGDPRSFTHGLETALRDAWRRWCREHPGKGA